jgi:hypothetical protein
MSLLLDTNGNYIGDDVAIFCRCISADNDTRAPKAFIQEQCRIIGAAAVGKADHSPDKGHVMKCLSNFFFKLKEEDASLRGVHALTPVRIKMIVTDISAALSNFTSLGVDDQAAKRACLDQIDAIILHHCGNHTTGVPFFLCHLKILVRGCGHLEYGRRFVKNTLTFGKARHISWCKFGDRNCSPGW